MIEFSFPHVFVFSVANYWFVDEYLSANCVCFQTVQVFKNVVLLNTLHSGCFSNGSI